jgi:short-subunit dehydrogenase
MTSSASSNLHVIVTGASSGIGEATARTLAAQGHRLTLAARRIEKLEALAKSLDPSGERVLAVACDVRHFDQLEQLIAQARNKFGPVQVLINNAGVDSGEEPLWHGDMERIHKVLETNLTAPFVLSKMVLDEMIAAKYGHIINIGSVAGHIAVSSAYSASKFGLRGLSLSLRRELLGTGVHVSLVSPGYIRTPMTAQNHDRFPMAEPEAVARVIADLLVRPRAEVVVPWWYRPLIWLEGLLPAIGDQVVKHR